MEEARLDLIRAGARWKAANQERIDALEELGRAVIVAKAEGFPVSTIAEVAEVSRQTVYSFKGLPRTTRSAQWDDDFVEWLITTRKAKGYTQTYLAHQASISPKTIGAIENRRAPAGQYVKERLRDVLEVGDLEGSQE